MKSAENYLTLKPKNIEEASKLAYNVITTLEVDPVFFKATLSTKNGDVLRGSSATFEYEGENEWNVFEVKYSTSAERLILRPKIETYKFVSQIAGGINSFSKKYLDLAIKHDYDIDGISCWFSTERRGEHYTERYEPTSEIKYDKSSILTNEPALELILTGLENNKQMCDVLRKWFKGLEEH